MRGRGGEVFRHFGYDFDLDEVRHQIGKGADKLIPYFLPPKEVRHLGRELDRFRSALWKRKYLSRVKPLPQVRELFERIRRDGKRIVLASSAKGDELERDKKIARIQDLVEKETSADDVNNSKPDPDIVQAALAKLKHPDPANAVMVGDTPYDAEAARQAGVRTIGVLSGGFGETELRRAGCIATYLDAADLLARYDESPIAGKEREAA